MLSPFVEFLATNEVSQTRTAQPSIQAAEGAPYPRSNGLASSVVQLNIVKAIMES